MGSPSRTVPYHYLFMAFSFYIEDEQHYSFSMRSYSSLSIELSLVTIRRRYVRTKPAAFVHTRRVLDRWHAFSLIGIVHTFTARNGGSEHIKQ